MRAWLWCPVLLLAAVLTLSCQRSSPEATVRQALDQANMPSVDVRVDEEAGVIVLAGSVGTMGDRARAEEIAAAAAGTTGRVLNDLTVSDLDEEKAVGADQELITRLDRRIDADPIFKQRDVNVDVAAGQVTLTGHVRSAEEKARVERMVKAVPGVTSVGNDLTIEPEP